MRHVIIGGSIAGISAARSIRSCSRDAEIIMISAESSKPYYRPLISSVIEKRDADLAFDGHTLETANIRTLHDQAMGIDARSKVVLLSSGRHMSYDKLLIATGSSPLIPDVPGIQGAGVFPLRTIEDARTIQAVACNRKHAAVLGGGFVGIKAAIALKSLGLQVTIIEKLDRILYEKLDRRGAAIVADLLKRQDIDIVTNQTDYEINRVGMTVRSIRLASGRIIDADLIIVAVGTQPNTGSFVGSGIKINKGIVVQDSLETNVADVFAAGDVVEFRDVVSNTRAVSTSWSNAEDMGRLAGKNMAGGNIKYTGFLALMNTINILNVPISTIGLVEPESDNCEVFTEGSEHSYRKLVFRNDVMVGALFIGQAEEPEIYTCLIRKQVPLGDLKEHAVRGSLEKLYQGIS